MVTKEQIRLFKAIREIMKRPDVQELNAMTKKQVVNAYLNEREEIKKLLIEHIKPKGNFTYSYADFSSYKSATFTTSDRFSVPTSATPVPTEHDLYHVNTTQPQQAGDFLEYFQNREILLLQAGEVLDNTMIHASRIISVTIAGQYAYIQKNTNSELNSVFESAFTTEAIKAFKDFMGEFPLHKKLLNPNLGKNEKPRYMIYWIIPLELIGQVMDLYQKATFEFRELHTTSDEFAEDQEDQEDFSSNFYVVARSIQDVAGSDEISSGYNTFFHDKTQTYIEYYNPPNSSQDETQNDCFFRCIKFALNLTTAEINQLRNMFNVRKDAKIWLNQMIDICQYLDNKYNISIRLFDKDLVDVRTSLTLNKASDNNHQSVNDLCSCYSVVTEQCALDNNYTILRYAEICLAHDPKIDLVVIEDNIPSEQVFYNSTHETKTCLNLFLHNEHCAILKKLHSAQICKKCSCYYTVNEIRYNNHKCFKSIFKRYKYTDILISDFETRLKLDRNSDVVGVQLNHPLGSSFETKIWLSMDSLEQFYKYLCEYPRNGVILFHNGARFDHILLHAYLKRHHRNDIIDDSLVYANGLKSFEFRAGGNVFKCIDTYCHIGFSLEALCDSFKVPEHLRKITSGKVIIDGKEIEISSKDLLTFRGDPEQEDYLNPQQFLDFMEDPVNDSFKKMYINYSKNDVECYRDWVQKYVNELKSVMGDDFQPFDSITGPSMANKALLSINQKQQLKLQKDMFENLSELPFTIQWNGVTMKPQCVDGYKNIKKLLKDKVKVWWKRDGTKSYKRLRLIDLNTLYYNSRYYLKNEFECGNDMKKCRTFSTHEPHTEEQFRELFEKFKYVCIGTHYHKIEPINIEDYINKRSDVQFFTVKDDFIPIFKGWYHNPKWYNLVKEYTFYDDEDVRSTLRKLINCHIVPPKPEKNGGVYSKPKYVTYCEKAIYGGISWYKNVGIFDGSYVCLDVISLYPTQMFFERFPYGTPETGFCFDNNNQIDLTKLAIIHVRNVIQQYDCIAQIPNKENGKNDWSPKLPIKEAWITNLDLYNIIQAGGSYELGDADQSLYWVDTHKPFKNYVNTFFKIKQAQDNLPSEQKNEALRTVSKNMLNTIFGFMCRSKANSRIYYAQSFNDFDGENVCNLGIDLDNNEFIFNTKEEVMNCPVWYGVFILAYARSHMQRLFDKVGRKNVYLTETDSIYIKKECLHLLQDEIGKSLGDLTLEWTDSSKLMIGGCKCYCVEGIVGSKKTSKEVFKGVNVKNLANNHVAYTDLINNGYTILENVVFERNMFRKNVKQGIVIRNVKKLILNPNVVLHTNKSIHFKRRKILLDLLKENKLPEHKHINELIDLLEECGY